MEEPLTPAPAVFTISDFSITPAEANPSEEVTVSAVVTNIGGSTGNNSVVLKIDNNIESQKEISLDPGKSEAVSFTITRDVAGNYTIDINGESQQFAVKSPPPPLQISGITPIEEQTPAATSWYWLLGVICGVIIAGLLIYFLFLRTRIGRPLHLSY